MDTLLLVAGKALYISNQFEAKCRYVLGMSRSAEIIEADPVISLEELFGKLPAEKKLVGPILNDLISRGYLRVGSDEAQALTKAREARNFIAHEGANIGSLYPLNNQAIADCLSKLRKAVADLAIGDNIISSWVFEIEEKGAEIPYIMTANYPELVDLWVFGCMTGDEDDPPWSLVAHQGLPGVPIVAPPTTRHLDPSRCMPT